MNIKKPQSLSKTILWSIFIILVGVIGYVVSKILLMNVFTPIAAVILIIFPISVTFGVVLLIIGVIFYQRKKSTIPTESSK